MIQAQIKNTFYFKKLISLDMEISRTDMVLDFFKLTDDDTEVHTIASVWIKSNKDDESKKSKCQNITLPIKNEDYLVI
jgi:hypothetical protein